MRFLTATLFCEGREDEAFLRILLERQLREIGAMGKGFGFEVLVPGGCMTATAFGDELDRAIVTASEMFDVVFVHNDHDQRQKCVLRDGRLAGKLASNSRTVNIIPIRETEAWALADPAALPSGRQSAQLPTKSQHVEKIADPKAILKQVLGRKYSAELAELIALGVSLDRLAEVPAYQSFLQDLTTALKELNFL
jgi:hypothetical protein